MAEAQAVGLSFAPGISTPSDIEQAVEYGCRVLKFFPAEQLGGLPYLKSIAAPYAHLDLSFIPLGGVDASNAERYLGEPSILALGGSWIAPRSLIQAQDWGTITQRARQASGIIEKLRPRIKA
jgi:2-dehydro-3-deoxyphosphogluconate aldolase/(4S)-4-hydroxy-2-oxoglutarate aldolase